MNTAQQILQECQSVGLVLEIKAGRLKFGYPLSLVTEKSRLVQIIDQLKTHKAELIKELSSGGLQEPVQPLDQITEWKTKIEALPLAANKNGATYECAKLVKYALAFLDSPHAVKAVSLGWDRLELFGVFHGAERAAKRRHDAMGLIPCMAWSKARGFMQSLDSKTASFVMPKWTQGTGHNLVKQRNLTSPYCSVPFWENDALMRQLLGHSVNEKWG